MNQQQTVTSFIQLKPVSLETPAGPSLEKITEEQYIFPFQDQTVENVDEQIPKKLPVLTPVVTPLEELLPQLNDVEVKLEANPTPQATVKIKTCTCHIC